MKVRLLGFGSSLALAALAALGCESERASSQEPPTPRTATLAKSKTPRADADAVPFHLLKFELLDAGAAPREAARYLPSKVSLAAVTRAAIKSDEGSREIKTGLALSGSAPGRVGLVGLAASGENIADAAKYAPPVEGARASADISDRGLVLRVDGVSSLDARREMTAMLIRHLVAFPEEAIGVGARWRVKYAIGRGGVFIAQTSIYELVGRQGNAITLRLELTESAEPQPILSQGQPVGELIALSSSAAGTLTVDLSQPVVTSGELTQKTTFHARAGSESVFRESTSTLTLGSK